MKGDTMNPDPVYQRLRETGWRRPLTTAEQAELRAWLAAHPEHQADAETDAALSRALAKLPDAPMPSNFTARVLQAIEREAATADRAAAKTSPAWWRVLIPRIAVASVVVGVGAIAYRHHQTVKQAELADAAKNLVTGAGAAPLSDLAVLADFETIRSMGQADEGLLALSEDLMSLKQ
jgi:anti-sigma factor RsiW